MRKWNDNLSLAENLRANAKQPVVRLSVFGSIAWSMIWVALAFLAYEKLEPETVLGFFLLGPLLAFVSGAVLVYAVLPRLRFGADVVRRQARAAEDGWSRQWIMAAPLLVAWLPLLRADDPSFVAVTQWIGPLVAAFAGGRLGVALLAFVGRVD